MSNGMAPVCAVTDPMQSRYAEHIAQLGGEHKLDLTSDVTHLLVGDTDTPKYKYVAKEREDVKVLRPEWVDAVREVWMADKSIDLDQLHAQYRMPTLAGLKICITGFDDLSFRAHLQQNVLENGGEYTGDLTKDVTHLIAARPSGKKFEYGTQWQKKVVSIRWYKDTLQRGMQLDETSYHPTIPDEEQGVGAWNKSARTAISQTAKRHREETSGLEPPRKMRRTISARLNSQNDDMWSDIVGNDKGSTAEVTEKQIQVAKSESDLRRPHEARRQSEGPSTSKASTSQAFTGRYFVIQAFTSDKTRIVRNVVLSLGGVIVESLADLQVIEDVPEDAKILLLPHQTPSDQTLEADAKASNFTVASELWIEHCMFTKSFHPPNSYPLGQLLPRTKPTGFANLVITSTGFSGIVPNHIAKMVQLLGAKYEQTFTRATTVLICNSSHPNSQKLELAHSWSTPVVQESWLWACLKENRKVSYIAHASGVSIPSKRAQTGSRHETTGTRTSDKAPLKGMSSPDNEVTQAANESVETVKAVPTRHQAIERPGSDFKVHTDMKPTPMDSFTAQSKPVTISQLETKMSTNQPLLPKSPNSSPQRLNDKSLKTKKRLFQTFEGPSSDAENAERTQQKNDGARQLATASIPASHVQTLNGEIRELLDQKARLKDRRVATVESVAEPKKKLMGRALSNLSNSSATSHVRQSRAGSVDSINTDGVGSEIGPSASANNKYEERAGSISNPSFIGRAKSKLLESGTSSLAIASASMDMEAEEQWAEEAPEPALTQLVYEDPEEAIKLREKLAAKRRLRSKLGQKDDDPKPKVQHVAPNRIKDDDVLVDSGWGAGRRTRQKDKSPQGLKGF